MARSDARLLILGSMPGQASLAACNYYAHPRNAFWPIMATLLGFPADSPIHDRYTALRNAGIALWDVLQECERRGSLDSAIQAHSAVDNDFGSFFQAHSQITWVIFNGTQAEKFFCRVRKTQTISCHLNYQRLPSTSPANAGTTFAQKLSAWSIIPALLASQRNSQ